MISWFGLVGALLGINEVAEMLFGQSIKPLHRYRWQIVLALLVIAQAAAYRDIQEKYERALVPTQVNESKSAMQFGGSLTPANWPHDGQWSSASGARNVTVEWPTLTMFDVIANVETRIVDGKMVSADNLQTQVRLVAVRTGRVVWSKVVSNTRCHVHSAS